MPNRILTLSALILFPLSAIAERPNILWFVVDDMSAELSCYGETVIQTPHLDRLAAEGTRFTRAYVTAPVCSTSRSAMITGMHQTTIGAHNHRSGRGQLKIHLPEGVVPVPALFQQAGYHTCIGSGLPGKDHTGRESGAAKGKGKGKGGNPKPLGKTDYNFEWDPAIYDSNDWADRKPGQPFFMQVQLHGGKMRADSVEGNQSLAKRAREELGSSTDPATVTLPPYYDAEKDPVLLGDWAAYLDSVRLTDHHVGHVIARLQEQGLLEDTLIIFMTDHGISHARGKQFLTDEGTHIPFILRGPGVPKGTVREDLVEHIDIAALSLAAAAIAIPSAMQARDILATDYQPRQAVFAARDRCDETVEKLRSVRTERFLYIRNFHPQRPHLQPSAYKDKKAILIALRAANENGTLSSVGQEVLFSPSRAEEELYDYLADPHQVTNLAANPDFRQALEEHRARLDQWLIESRDPAPESMAMYDSDMAEYLKRNNPVVERNIALMKQWAAEGK